RAEEAALRSRVNADPQLKDAASAWDDVIAALKVHAGIYNENYLLELGIGFNSESFIIARTLLRMAEETRKPNGERFREYRDSNLESLKQQLFSEAPIYADLETVKLADSLGMMLEMLGAEHPACKLALAGKSPRNRAAELIQGTKLRDVGLRKKLAEVGRAAIDASSDPMLLLAKAVD